MTKKQQFYKKNLIQQVHLSKMYQNHYKHNKEDYQHLLFQHFKVISSKDLDIENLIKLVDYLNGKCDIKNVTPNSATTSQLNKLKLLWGNNSHSKCIDSLITFLSTRVIRRKIVNLTELTRQEATNSIVAVEKLRN
jgi:hypothetical protein